MSRSSRPPNILWVVTTQWRAQACGYAGDSNAQTPSIDLLSRTSLNYVQAVTPHPFGPFARAALLTGQPSPQNGVVDYYDPLPRDARTIAHDLKERGYTTAFFGKWHLGERDRSVPLVGEAHAKTIVPPNARGGFAFWEGFEGGFQLYNPWLHGTGLPEPTRFSGYQSDVICDRAAAWIREQSTPWFAIVSLEPPHPPYRIPFFEESPRPEDYPVERGEVTPPISPSIAMSDPAALRLRANVPLGGEAEQKARTELAGYYAHIEATDRAIGKLMASDATKDWAVVFTSVHGDMHGSHGLFRKGWPYEESVRVPLLVRHPHLSSRESHAAINLLDLRRLSCEWADGRVAELDRSSTMISMPSVVPFPQQCDQTWRAIRTRTRKLVLRADGSPWLFFNLEDDPLELNNLISDPRYESEMEQLRAMIDSEPRARLRIHSDTQCGPRNGTPLL